MRPTALLIPLLLVAASGSAQAQHWSRSWMAAPLIWKEPTEKRPVLTDRTIRQVVRISNGGDRLRLQLSNQMSEEPLLIGAVHIALAGEDGRILPGTDRVVSFNRAQGATIPPRAPLISDPIDMAIKPLTRLTVSIHLPNGAASPTIHAYAAATNWIAQGDQTSADSLTGATTIGPRLILSAVDVETRKPATTIVTLGDSITDGVRATNDSNRRWPDLLAERLQKAGRKTIGIANAGISANRLLSEAEGYNALARFDSDVLAVPGVTHVVILEGVNDLGSAARDGRPMPSPDTIIGAYRQMIARAHGRGVKVILATILPYKGAGYWSEPGETTRLAVNQWIRDNREADGVVDFAKAIADPTDPTRMAKPYDVGDALHPNDAGFAAMAAAVDLTLFR